MFHINSLQCIILQCTRMFVNLGPVSNHVNYLEFFLSSQGKGQRVKQVSISFHNFCNFTLSLSYLILYSALGNYKQTGYSHYSSIDVWSRGVKGKGKPSSLSFLFLMNCLLFISIATSTYFTKLFPYISIQLVLHVTFPYALQFLKLSIFASCCAHIKHNKFV